MPPYDLSGIMYLMRTFVLYVIFQVSFSTSAKEIVLGATDWCPYTCSTLENGGVVNEYISTIAGLGGFSTKVKFLPWSRAVKMSQAGTIDGILTGVNSEAPKLVFTSVPTMHYRSCVFSTKEQEKLSVKDLKDKTLAFISSYSYGEKLDNLLKSKEDKKLELKGTKLHSRLYRVVSSGRADFFLADENVAKYYLGSKIYPVFCGESTPFFLGVNKAKKSNISFKNFLNKNLKGKESLLKDIIQRTLKEGQMSMKKNKVLSAK